MYVNPATELLFLAASGDASSTMSNRYLSKKAKTTRRISTVIDDFSGIDEGPNTLSAGQTVTVAVSTESGQSYILSTVVQS